MYTRVFAAEGNKRLTWSSVDEQLPGTEHGHLVPYIMRSSTLMHCQFGRDTHLARKRKMSARSKV